MQIKHIDYGIASRIGNCVYIHKNLKDYLKLYNAILKHELDHTSHYSWKDVKIDIRNNHLEGLRRDYYSFLIVNPSALLQLSPVLKYDNKWSLDLTLMIFYGITFIIVGLLGWLL